MNSYINELSEMVPTCNENPKKPDKLTILRMAVDHIKHLRGRIIQEIHQSIRLRNGLGDLIFGILIISFLNPWFNCTMR